jgi:hypothetical protein
MQMRGLYRMVRVPAALTSDPHIVVSQQGACRHSCRRATPRLGPGKHWPVHLCNVRPTHPFVLCRPAPCAAEALPQAPTPAHTIYCSNFLAMAPSGGDHSVFLEPICAIRQGAA